MTICKQCSYFIAGIFSLLLSVSTSSALEPVKGDVVLQVSGNIAVTNTDDGKAVFDRAILMSLPATEIETETPWTDGVVKFEGVLLRDLMELLKATGKSLKATAINDYTVDIPVEDFLKYDVILAYKMNGNLMSVRDKGPLWVIYPWSDNPAIQTEIFHSRSIWQLIKISVK